MASVSIRRLQVGVDLKYQPESYKKHLLMLNCCTNLCVSLESLVAIKVIIGCPRASGLLFSSVAACIAPITMKTTMKATPVQNPARVILLLTYLAMEAILALPWKEEFHDKSAGKI